MCRMILLAILGLFVVAGVWSRGRNEVQRAAPAPGLDTQVRRFLEQHEGTWRDLNVPSSDGQALYDIIVRHKFKNALEIGTSTGHSGIWLAWALSKTGGRLLTIEIDKSRYEEARANFQAAGVARFIDARLGDAHKLVPALPDTFDFVFCDADKEWYKNYLLAVLPKMTVGGCFAAHNVSERGYASMNRGFLQYIRSLPYLETTLVETGSGMSVSYKKSEK